MNTTSVPGSVEPSMLDVAAAHNRIAQLNGLPQLDILAHIRAAVEKGVRPAAIIRQIFRVHRGPGRLTLPEYLYYQLHDPALDPEETLRFIGKAKQNAFHYACNDQHWRALADDKALFYAAAAGLGLPVPRVRAVFAPGPRGFPAETLRSVEELTEFLRNTSYPIFAKPISGIYSVGVMSLAGLENGHIRFTTGEIVRLDAVVDFIRGFGGDGFLFQDRLEPHRELHRAFGGTLPTIRFLVLITPEGATIESAVLKIPSARNPADNYWRTGNMLGALDEAGMIRRVVTGVGSAMREVSIHAETGAPLLGLSVPDWNRTVELCRQAAACFSSVRTQSWDIALTTTGPQLLEFNWGGDLNLHQLAHRRGALTPHYAEHLRRCGLR